MYLSVATETEFFLFSILAGILSAFIYDIFRISRKIVRVSDIVIDAEDIIFFIASATLVFLAAYIKNNGEIRWQSFIGLGLGIGMYIFIVRNRILDFSVIIIKFAVKATGFVISVILFPLRLIMRIFKKPVSVVAWYTGRGVKRVKSAAKSRSIKLRRLLKNLKFMLRKKHNGKRS